MKSPQQAPVYVWSDGGVDPGGRILGWAPSITVGLAEANLAWRLPVIDNIKQEYLAYLFLNNNNAKMHSQLMKDLVNDYSKGNTMHTNIHKVLTS